MYYSLTRAFEAAKWPVLIVLGAAVSVGYAAEGSGGHGSIEVALRGVGIALTFFVVFTLARLVAVRASSAPRQRLADERASLVALPMHLTRSSYVHIAHDLTVRELRPWAASSLSALVREEALELWWTSLIAAPQMIASFRWTELESVNLRRVGIHSYKLSLRAKSSYSVDLVVESDRIFGGQTSSIRQLRSALAHIS